MTVKQRNISSNELLTVYLTVCFPDEHFVSSSTDNQRFISEQKEKSVRNFRTFTIISSLDNTRDQDKQEKVLAQHWY